MQDNKYNIKNNITLHCLKDERYKSNVIAVFLTVPLLRETVTLNALIPAVLKRGTAKYTDMQSLEVHLEEMYGSVLGGSVDKIGNNQVLKFFTETLKDSMVSENLFQQSIDNILSLVFDPYLEKGIFKNEYVDQEKQLLEITINNKVNSKESYARHMCLEEVCGLKGYGLYSFGYAEDIEGISNAAVYNQYISILRTARIDIFTYTDMDDEYIKESISGALNYSVLEQRENIYIAKPTYIPTVNDPKLIKEDMDVVQGKLVLGLTIPEIEKYDPYDIIVLNAILGVGCNSKLFKYVREKEHLAYYAMSNYIKNTNIVLIESGIELTNYDKAVKVINKQLSDLKKGNISKAEFNDAKIILTTSYKTLYDSHFRIINYYVDQSIMNNNISIEEALERINNTKMNNIVSIAKAIKINTIYFLENRGAK